MFSETNLLGHVQIPLMSSALLKHAGRVRLLLAAAAAVGLAGCSEMRFVNSSETESEAHDPRRDIHLAGVETSMTSGSALMRRVKGETAVYSEDRGLLSMDHARVEMFRPDGSLQGVTSSDRATIYMTDQADSEARKGDLEFAGDFRYRAPSENDPTTDSLTLATDRLVWDETRQVYRCPSPYRMISNSARGPMVLAGNQFIATQDLKKFTMGGGSVSNDPEKDPREELQQLGQKVQTEVDDILKNYKPRPTPAPLVLPEAKQVPRTESMINRAQELKRAGTAR